MNIMIAGGGIGGLTTALCLHAAGFTAVRVAEAAPAIRPMGAGVNLLPNAVRELHALGLYDSVAAVSVPIERLGYLTGLGEDIWTEPRGLPAGYDWPQLAVHRGALQMILAQAVRDRLGADAVTADARLCSFGEAEGPELRIGFSHRESALPTELRADVLIGCDGIHSTVRGLLYPQEGPPSSSGAVVWRGVSRCRPFLGGRSMVVMGDGDWKAVVYPLADRPDDDGTVPVNWAVSRESAASGEARSADAAAGRELGPVPDWRCGDLALAEVLAGQERVRQFPMIDRDPLPRWSFGRVTLLGDAAHAMAPMGSNATTQCIVDARTLAHALAADPDPVRALAAYDRRRRPAMNRLQVLNRAKGPEVVIDMAHGRAAGGTTCRARRAVPAADLARVTASYARAAGSDRASVNRPSPYTVDGGLGLRGSRRAVHG
ncbi:FAD-dependent monooxygenase [Streptomyces sp. NPDC012600]|uniref:FAD-dependent monooxygenase n=2 Tax=Streptomyces TaxID=1883 RepID=A0ABU2W9X3_9ACTN|nr:FAD-dependent monooxygenase [Streptomyces griseus]MDT0494109.1 FAD-dependent monooxygenase [Streptomyces griseus]